MSSYKFNHLTLDDRISIQKALKEGKTFIETIIDKLSEIGIEDILISGYDYNSDEFRFVEDKYSNKGPLAGIHAGLEAAAHDSVLVITEDAPLVPVEYIKQLERNGEASHLAVSLFAQKIANMTV